MTRVSERTFHKSRQHSMIVTLIYIGKQDSELEYYEKTSSIWIRYDMVFIKIRRNEKKNQV